MSLEGEVREKARELSIALIGFSAVEKTNYAEIVHERIAKGLIPRDIIERIECFRTPEIFADPRKSLASAKTLICIGQPYFEKKAVPDDMSRRASIARHVWRDSYTDVESKRDALVEFLRSKGFDAAKAKMHPREAAKLTGISWIGKNNFAINPTYGSWALYCSMVTDAMIEPTPRIDKRCPENCRRCMDACPSKALVAPYTLEVERCLNFIMEENGPAPSYARPLLGNRINGCDACQEACPMNKKVPPAPEPLTAKIPDPKLVPFPELERCFQVGEREMEKNFSHMDWYEPKVRYLRRNALIAIGNSGEKSLLKTAKKFGDSDDSVLSDHARWAIEKLS